MFQAWFFISANKRFVKLNSNLYFANWLEFVGNINAGTEDHYASLLFCTVKRQFCVMCPSLISVLCITFHSIWKDWYSLSEYIFENEWNLVNEYIAIFCYSFCTSGYFYFQCSGSYSSMACLIINWLVTKMLIFATSLFEPHNRQKHGHYAAILIGHVTGLANLSVHLPSVLYYPLLRKQKGVEKPKLMSTFPRAGISGEPIFSLEVHILDGPLHSMLALDQCSFVVSVNRIWTVWNGRYQHCEAVQSCYHQL